MSLIAERATRLLHVVALLGYALVLSAGVATAQSDPVQIHPLPGENDGWTAILGAAQMDLDPSDEIVLYSIEDRLVIVDAASGAIEFDSGPYGWAAIYAPGWNQHIANPGYGGHNNGFDIFCDEDDDGIFCVQILVSSQSLYERELAVVCLDRNPSSAPSAPAEAQLELRANQPNPFGPSTQIDFSLPHSGRAGLRVFDAQGRLVRGLLDRVMEAGDHSVVWDGTSDLGSPAPSGMYFYELEADGKRSARKAVLLRSME